MRSSTPKKTSSSISKALTSDEFAHMFDLRFDAHLAKIRRAQRQLQADARKYRSSLVPRMDLHQYTSGPSPRVEAILELPGLSKDEVFLRVEPGLLIVHGERKAPLPRRPAGVPQDEIPDVSILECDVNTPLREIKYGRFRRDIPLPSGLQPTQVKAFLSDGLLWVAWPLPREANNTAECPSTSLNTGGTKATATASGAQAADPQDSESDLARVSPEENLVPHIQAFTPTQAMSSTKMEED